MEYVPAVAKLALQVATPLERVDAEQPVLELQEIIPVAVLGETVAVKVTAWPAMDGFVPEVKAVVVLATFTISDKEPLVLPEKELVPE